MQWTELVGIHTAIETLCKLAANLASFALLAMAFLVTADVAWDLAFGRPIANAIEIVSIYLMIAIVFLPMGFVELRHDHIGADIISRLLSPRVQSTLRVVVALVSFCFLLVIVYQTGVDAFEALAKNERIMGTSLFSIWPSRFSLPIGFSIFALAILSNTLRDALGQARSKLADDIEEGLDRE
ncbi:hypothetical protein DDE20_18555 [Pararhodobacter oceanensis]|uniref:TRAP transporter small permease protein n=1 Tax=Pararhodobacter oceanensis TaxID=2172121 RepID=A0A2T8HP88_9RHOB|nr:hypothetical protein DDE20_18555 [Pararhodobacter oceanensis]